MPRLTKPKRPRPRKKKKTTPSARVPATSIEPEPPPLFDLGILGITPCANPDSSYRFLSMKCGCTMTIISDTGRSIKAPAQITASGAFMSLRADQLTISLI